MNSKANPAKSQSLNTDVSLSSQIDKLLKAAKSASIRINIDPPTTTARQIAETSNIPQNITIVVAGCRGQRSIIAFDETLTGYIITPDGRVRNNTVSSIPGISIMYPNKWWSPASFTKEATERFTRPIIKLLALCHSENFPLPRFALGISDIAGALRSGYFGQVSLMDMQLGDTINAMVKACTDEVIDIIGISSTFGQQDLLEDLLKELTSSCPNALIVAGGSLATLNGRAILQKHPCIIVAKSEGETTMCDVVEYWRGIRTITSINDIEFYLLNDFYNKMASLTPYSVPYYRHNHMKHGDKQAMIQSISTRRTSKRNIYRDSVQLPELDLLSKTLDCHGVMQLESSRGCTFACSFCPREHKGSWYGDQESNYDPFLVDVRTIYEAYPSIAKKIFLVDEEFFGYHDNAEDRVFRIAESLNRTGFKFETSARVDQVYQLDKDNSWHAKRLGVWRKLVELGMDRCLFGIESGVESVLRRFCKKITSKQNIVAIRMLSLANIPIRFTYITFDPLMTMNELIDTYRFMGRTDLWLRPSLQFDMRRLVHIAESDSVTSELSTRTPLYKHMSYMLVSLECLVGSDYLRQIESMGLARNENLLMGRRDSDYVDPVIGILSKHAQMWIDRSFALDYTLKSIAKITDKAIQSIIVSTRGTLKDFAYRLLGMMLVIVTEDTSHEAQPGDGQSAIDYATKSGWTCGANKEALSLGLRSVMTHLFEELKKTMSSRIAVEMANLDTNSRQLIKQEIAQWAKQNEWKLINGQEQG